MNFQAIIKSQMGNYRKHEIKEFSVGESFSKVRKN